MDRPPTSRVRAPISQICVRCRGGWWGLRFVIETKSRMRPTPTRRPPGGRADAGHGPVVAGPLATVVADLPVSRNRMPPRADPRLTAAARPPPCPPRSPPLRQRQVPSLAGPNSFASPLPACQNYASATRPAAQSHTPSGAASPTGLRPECETSTTHNHKNRCEERLNPPDL
jgi:hypothetical protein